MSDESVEASEAHAMIDESNDELDEALQTHQLTIFNDSKEDEHTDIAEQSHVNHV